MTPCPPRLVGALACVCAIGLLLLVDASSLVAQAPSPAAASPQMRHFWHVFAAYAIAWVLVFGWAVAIARRIRRVERMLDRSVRGSSSS